MEPRALNVAEQPLQPDVRQNEPAPATSIAFPRRELPRGQWYQPIELASIRHQRAQDVSGVQRWA